MKMVFLRALAVATATLVPVQETGAAVPGHGPDERAAASARLDGSAVDDLKAGRIMTRQMPKITMTASPDTVFGGVELLTFTLTREAPLASPLTVTVRFTQEQDWLSSTSFEVDFAAGDSTAELLLGLNDLSTDVTESGTLTATVDSVSGYDTDEATASAYVLSRDGPFVTVMLSDSSYTFPETSGDTALIVTARMASGLPRGVSFDVSIQSRGGSSARPDLTAVIARDYSRFDRSLRFQPRNYALENGRWVARRRVPLTLLDDDVREGTENFEALLEHAPGFTKGIQRLNPDGSACDLISCPYPVYITDDEDIPVLALSVSADEISEEDGTSSTATVSITNGKTFATDQTVTFAFTGTATEGTDYTVAPADGDDMVPDHQVVMPADSTSVAVTLTATDDDIADGNETIEVSATHDGNAVGSTQTIRILNQEVLPKITMTASQDTIFGGVEPLTLTLTREAPLDAALTVTVRFTQEQDWLSSTSFEVDFAAGDSTAELFLNVSRLSADVTESGTLAATVDSVTGYDTDDATASVYVVSRDGPFVEVSLSDTSYVFEEDDDSTYVILTARMAAGMPRGFSFQVSVSTRRQLGVEAGPDCGAVNGL